MESGASCRRTKRWEAHIWDDKKQVYLGGFDVEEHAGDHQCMLTLSAHACAVPLLSSLMSQDCHILRPAAASNSKIALMNAV